MKYVAWYYFALLLNLLLKRLIGMELSDEIIATGCAVLAIGFAAADIIEEIKKGKKED